MSVILICKMLRCVMC